MNRNETKLEQDISAARKMTLNDDVKPPRWPGWACLG
jgi:hypothetical protein